jgi:hypothetical protein
MRKDALIGVSLAFELFDLLSCPYGPTCQHLDRRREFTTADVNGELLFRPSEHFSHLLVSDKWGNYFPRTSIISNLLLSKSDISLIDIIGSIFSPSSEIKILTQE